LPTEVEWEKATHGTNSLAFPWGDGSPTYSLANYQITGSNWRMGDTSPVGRYPGGANPYGVLDMASNVLEWVNDWFENDYYSISPYYTRLDHPSLMKEAPVMSCAEVVLATISLVC